MMGKTRIDALPRKEKTDLVSGRLFRFFFLATQIIQQQWETISVVIVATPAALAIQ